jgi:hypothetical protein
MSNTQAAYIVSAIMMTSHVPLIGSFGIVIFGVTTFILVFIER